MVKSGQIEEITSNDLKWNYLTTITKQQIKTLIKENVIQLDLFAEEIIEVKTDDNTRYILRRNPMRSEDLKINRQSKIDKVKLFVSELNIYLKEHKKAKIETAIKKLDTKISRLKLNKIIQTNVKERVINIEIDSQAQKKAEELDGFV